MGFLILFRLIPLSAQLSQPARWEVENGYTEEAYSIISLKKEGLALLRDLEKFEDGKKKWELIILDTAFQERWRTEIDLRDDARFTGFEYINGRLNLMFRRNETEILRADMLWIDLATQEITRSFTEIKLQIRLSHYTVVDNNCVFGGYVSREPVLLIYDPDKNNSIIVPGFFLTDTELMDVRPNANSTFNILLFVRTPTQKKIIFRTIDKAGNILVEAEILVDEDKSILSAATSVLEHDEVLIGGAYSYKNDKQASGIFSCMIDPFSDQPVRYTELPLLRHFLDYLPAKKVRKIKERTNERSNYNKPLNFRTNINIHRIEEFDNGFALFGETFVASSASATNIYSAPYQSQFRSYTYTPFASRYYNNPYLYPPTPVIEEIRILQSFVVGFDFLGKPVWDYSIPMNNLKVARRDQVSDFMVSNNVPHFIYKEDNELKYSYHSQDTSRIEKPNSVPIKLEKETDEVRNKDEWEGNVRYWYSNYFYVWGIQSIRNKSSKNFEGSRRVFYINKIQVE